MKYILTILLGLIVISSNAQYSRQYREKYSLKTDMRYIAPISCLATGFVVNEYKFRHISVDTNPSQFRKETFTVYCSCVVSAIATHYLIKWVEDKKPFKKHRRRY
jgi:hypothetical protein